MMKAEQEALYDKMEQMSFHALMVRKAYHTDPKKRLKPTDFFKRPDQEELDREHMEETQEKIRRQQEFLDQHLSQIITSGKG